ncbi:MAG: hypothetical protein V5A37_02850 [Halobacteriales archaeon]
MAGLTEADLRRIRRYLHQPPHRRRPAMLVPDDDPADDRIEQVAGHEGELVMGTRDAGSPPIGAAGHEPTITCPACDLQLL